ncbi:MAG: hypothetical protein VW547_00200 [Alphaproteobacteria bacterium]
MENRKGEYRETLHWANARDGFESVVTIFNYLGWAFPDRDSTETDADVKLRFFAENGTELAPHTVALKTEQSLHIPVGDVHPGFRGMVATRMQPRGGMRRRSATAENPGRPIATSFFILYERTGGFRDFSHELFLLQDRPGKAAEWATVVYLNDKTEASVVVMNNRLPESGPICASEAEIRMFGLDGAPLTDGYRFSLSPGGSRLVSLAEAFPGYSRASRDSAIATVSARNIEQPMTLHIHRSGDFNVHHF